MHGPSEIRTHRSERVGALGSLHRTDEKGELRLPPFVKNACVSASHEGLYDYTSLRAGKDESDVRFVVQK